MKRKNYILLFALTISVSLAIFGCVYSVIRESDGDNFAYQFVINFPIGILIGLVDLILINMSHKRKNRQKWENIVLDLITTSVFCAVAICLINYLLSAYGEWTLKIVLRSVIYAWLWNWFVVLLMELFFDYLRQTEIEKEKAQYQFKMLKNQINPHFLFNSLNVLASLAYQDAERTNRFAKKLSSVYRYLLTTYERQTVTLEEELAFVDSYLYLEHIRFGDSLRVEINGQTAKSHRQVIPVSIQTLAENALKHNICTLKSPLYIQIEVSDDAVTVSNNLQLRDCGNPCGMGLENLRQQYALYGKEIHITKTEFAFIVTLPFIR